MKNILVAIGRIYYTQFECIYLKNQKLFVNILLYF